MTNPINTYTVPSVSITTARTGASAKANELGMRTMQERAYAKRGEQYLLIKSPPASGKSRALMFIALDKLHNQGIQQAIVVVPERSIGGSFADEALTQHGFYWDWTIAPQWNLCNAPGVDEARVAKSKVEAVNKFLASGDKVLICTHATFRFAVEELGIQAFDNRLIAVDEFHHVSANPDNKLGSQLGAFIARDKVHLVAMTGSYFRGDSEAVLGPADEGKFETVTYTYYEQLNGYRWLKSLDIGYFFYTGRYVDAVAKVLDPALKTIVHIPSVNSRESLKDKEREVNEIMQALGEWKGIDETTGFHLIEAKDGRTLKVADLVDDSDAAKRSRVLGALKDPAHKHDRDHVDLIIALGMAKEGFDWIWCEHALTIGYRSSLTEVVQIIGRATRALHQPDRRAVGRAVRGGRGGERHAQGDIRQPVDGAGAGPALRVHAAERRRTGRLRLRPRRLRGRRQEPGREQGDRRNPHRDQRPGQAQEQGGQAHLQGRPERSHRCLHPGQACARTRHAGQGQHDPRGTDHRAPGQDRARALPGAERRRPGSGAPTRHCRHQHHPAGQAGARHARPGAAADRYPGGRRWWHLRKGQYRPDRRRSEVHQRARPGHRPDRPHQSVRGRLCGAGQDDGRKVLAPDSGQHRRKKNIKITEDEARELARRALQFKNERGRVPDINSADAWEKRMAEGVAAFAHYRAQAKAAQAPGASGNG